MKKQILLTALTLTLLASAVMTTAAEEVVATILSRPAYGSLLTRGLFFEYTLEDTTGYIRYMRMFGFDKRGETKVYNILYRYLTEGRQIIFENEGLKPIDTFEIDRLLVLMINERRVEIDQFIPRDLIADEFPYLDKKLRAQGH